MELTTIIIIVAASGIVIAGITWAIIAYLLKRKYKFLYITSDGKSAKIMSAGIWKDPSNKMHKEFLFPNGNRLPLKDPFFYFAGKAYRMITLNQNNDYCYVTGAIKFDIENYLKVALEPEEKQITMFRIKENQERYASPMDKWQAMLMLVSIVLMVILAGGTIYGTIQYGKMADKVVIMAKQNNEAADKYTAVADAQTQITAQLASITAALTKDENLTRQVS